MADWMPVLIAQAWQVTLLIVIVATINRWVGKSRPHLAHALWLVVLVKCVTLPIWSSPSGVFCWLQPSQESDRPPLAVEASSQSWSELLAAARSTGSSEVIEQANPDWLGSDAAAEESLLSVGDERIETLPSPSITSDIEWPNVLLGLWVSASLGVLGVAIVRWLRCWRMVRSAPQRDCAELSAQLDSLAKQLRLRRRVRLIVTESRIGPAVIGLFRTTVLLPALIVDRLAQRSRLAESSPVAPRQESRTSFDSQSSEGIGSNSPNGSPLAERQGYRSLTPILAHELLHIRRGDLWVGLLQTVTQAVWWCHPLVWWVNRRTTREAERCCDEEVLAELGCDPAAYARALVDVLELKRELKPVPVFPGVRPVEVTSQRLERIMQLGQGCRRRTPWWCWLIAGLAAAATWPGAAFVVTAEDAKETGERGGVSPPVISPQPTNRGADAAPLANASDGTIDLDKEPNLGLAYRVRVIRGAEDDLRALAQKFNEKLIAKPGDPIIVEHDELLRLLKEAQAFPRLTLKSHPVAACRGRESVTIGDTKSFAVPVEVTAADGTRTLHEQSREHGWRLTMQPLSVGIESLRLRVVNELSRLDNDAAVKVRYRTTGEEKLIPGLNVRRTNTTVELKNGQHVVFPITKVPDADGQDAMLAMMQARLIVLEDASEQSELAPTNVPGPQIGHGVGVNANSGITGEIVYEKVGEAPAVRLPVPFAVAAPDGLSERQILLSFKIYEVDEDGLKELGIKLGRAKTTWDGLKARSVAQFQVDRDVIEKLSVMEREQRIKVLCSPSVTTLDGHIASFLSGGEFPVPAIVGVGEAKGTATTFRGFGLQLTAKPTIVGPDSLRLSLTMSDSKVADEPTGGATTVAPTLISQSIQSELLLKSKQPVFFGPLGEPGAKGNQRIATLLADIVEPEHNLPVSGEPLKSLVRPAGGHITALKAQPAPVVAGHEKLVTVNFENVPLKAAMKQLAQSTGRNIVIEKPGLEDEALTERVPITLALDDVKLSSVLKLMLDPLNLGYRVEESGVIVVTSQQRLKGQPIVVTYSVADLSVSIPKRVSVKLAADRSVVGEASKPSEERTKPMQSTFRELCDLIQSTCQPNSWEEVGGTGRLKANDSTLSLVVRQTQDVHDEIRDLLGQLRRLQQTQAALQIESWTVPDDFWDRLRDLDVDLQTDTLPVQKRPADMLGLQASPAGRLLFPQSQPNPPADAPLFRLGLLTQKEAKLLRSVCQTKASPKITLLSGQELELIDGLDSPPTRLVLKPVLSGDRQGMRLHAAVLKHDDVKAGAEPDFTKCAVFLAAEHALLLDIFPQQFSVVEEKVTTLSLNGITTKNLGQKNVNAKRRTLLLVTGTVLIAEEEEELLGIPK